MHETQKRQQRPQHKKKRRPEKEKDNVDGDVPLCLRKTEGKSNDGSSRNKKNNEEKMKEEAAH